MSLTMGFQTLYKFEVKKDGKVVRESGWSPNIVLTQGLERLHERGIPDIVSVGTGVAPPSKNDTKLENQAWSSTHKISLVEDINVDEGYYYIREKHQFEQGRATGNLTEVGLGTGNNMFSRALIRDARGQEAVVTVLEDEALDVIVEIRCYVDLEMKQVGIYVSNELYQCRILPFLTKYGYAYSKSEMCRANYIDFYEGSIVNNITRPDNHAASSLGTHAIRVTNDILPHTPYSRQEAIYLDLKTGNGRNLRTLIIRLGMAAFQIEYTPAFPKTSDNVLKLIVNYTWGAKE